MSLRARLRVLVASKNLSSRYDSSAASGCCQLHALQHPAVQRSTARVAKCPNLQPQIMSALTLRIANPNSNPAQAYGGALFVQVVACGGAEFSRVGAAPVARPIECQIKSKLRWGRKTNISRLKLMANILISCHNFAHGKPPRLNINSFVT